MTFLTHNRPLRVCEYFLKLAADGVFIEEVLGDLEEGFHKVKLQQGVVAAYGWHTLQTAKSIGSFMMSRFENSNPLSMLIAILAGLLGYALLSTSWAVLNGTLIVPALRETTYTDQLIVFASMMWGVVSAFGAGVGLYTYLGRRNYLVLAIVALAMLSPAIIFFSADAFIRSIVWELVGMGIGFSFAEPVAKRLRNIGIFKSVIVSD